MNGDAHILVSYGKPKGRRGKKRSKRASNPTRSPERMTYASVGPWAFPVGGSHYSITSSNLYDLELSKDDWSQSVREMVQKTRREGGSEKGRVLYMTKEPSGALVAVLAYHVEATNELHIRTLSSSISAKDYEKDLIPPLLACCDEILRRHPRRQGAARIVCPIRGNAATLCRDEDFRQADRDHLARHTSGT